MQLSFRPTLDSDEAERRLSLLLAGGSLEEPSTVRRIERLASAFRSYAASYPLALWAPGLIVTNEMRSLTEALFPVEEAAAVFDLVLGDGCRFTPQLSGTYLHTSPSWPDLLHKLRPQSSCCDPAPLLRELVRNPQQRKRFLFSLLLPRHFGGGFDRYPRQAQWIANWLEENRARLGGRVRALDSACGSGEGTYGLAEMVAAAGFDQAVSAVHGSTIEPIELFAGAHAFFPHDVEREREYRARVAPLVSEQKIQIEFYLDEVGREAADRDPYDLILCNGLLGGPLLNEPRELSRAIGALVARLAPGGVLLAADRFHAGWRRRISTGALCAFMEAHGMAPVALPEGIGGRKER